MLVDLDGFEPSTSSMPWKRAPNCATGPQERLSQTITQRPQIAGFFRLQGARNAKMHLRMRFAKYFLLCSFAALISLDGQDIKLASGLNDEQVLQRNAHHAADVHLTGKVTGKKTNGKPIEARITSSKGVLPNFDWVPVGRVQKLSWTADMIGIPTGGPYRIELRMQGGTSIIAVSNILVGDLWILAGQSNMEGVGDLIDVQRPDPMVHSFDLAEQWGVAREPLHTLVSAVDRVHWRAGPSGEPERWTGPRLQQYMQERRKGAGLGLPFAIEMFKRTGIPVGLIPCAHGGTSMEQWSPSLKDREGDSLYGSMVRRFHEGVGGSEVCSGIRVNRMRTPRPRPLSPSDSRVL